MLSAAKTAELYTRLENLESVKALTSGPDNALLLSQYKERFKTLGRACLMIESKKKFLELISSGHARSLLDSARELQKLEKSKEELDITVMSVQQEQQRIQTESRDFCSLLQQEKESLPHQVAHIENLRAELESAKQRLHSLTDKHQVFVKETVAEIMPRAQQQREEKENMEQAYNQRYATKQILQSALARQQELVEKLESNVEALKTKDNAIRESQAQLREKKEILSEWFTGCENVLAGLLGYKVDIGSDADQQLAVTLTSTMGDKSYKTIILIDEATLEPLRIKMTPTKIPVDDLLKNYGNDISALVRCIHQRVIAFADREEEFASLPSKTSCTVDYNAIKNPDVVFIQLPTQPKTMCAFKLERDYPAPMLPLATKPKSDSNAFRLASLFSLVSVEPFDSARFELAKDRLFVSSPVTITDAVRELSTNW